jgi:hypothetical protein
MIGPHCANLTLKVCLHETQILCRSQKIWVIRLESNLIASYEQVWCCPIEFCVVQPNFVFWVPTQTLSILQLWTMWYIGATGYKFHSRYRKKMFIFYKRVTLSCILDFFWVYHPVKRDDRHLLAHAMDSWLLSHMAVSPKENNWVLVVDQTPRQARCTLAFTLFFFRERRHYYRPARTKKLGLKRPKNCA